jgi:CRISPR-associated endonuclease/helicase Cas3
MTGALYAKSPNRRGERLGLYQHLVDTEEAVQLVFAPSSRWQLAWLRFFRIPAEQVPRFWLMLRVAALFHDIGKANRDFQRAVTELRAMAQSLRHEHLSALVLCLPECRRFLIDGGLDADLVIAAVLSHHVKAALSGDYAWCQARGSATVELYLQHTDIERTFERVRTLLGRPEVPSLTGVKWTAAPPWTEAFEWGRRQASALNRSLRGDPERRRTLAALKAGLIVADAVASAMVREGRSTANWLDENAHTPSVTADEISEAVLAPRANEVETKTGKVFALHSFQTLAGQEGSRSLLMAPCGAGKTLAAWTWAQNQSRNHAFGRVIFLYPTRGTATEGYRDYVAWAPEGEATLLHGTSAFELASMRDNPPESLRHKDGERAEAEARMFALGLWRFRFFSATVDQFLSFMQNRYQSLCLLPALADSVLIFDEVHSYDRTLFDLLVSFLTEFDVPALCMTATLPPERSQRLQRAGLVPFPRPEHRADLQDLAESAEHPRYHIRYESDARVAIEVAIAAFRRGDRVLVVVNRVARCVEVAKLIATAIGERPLVYHSRFRLTDRQARHGAVVAAFQTEGAAIAVTTQVCEMSLDLDAQTLVTEVAPASSLVQRFGRANRHLKRPDVCAEVVVCPPDKPAPYDREELASATEFIRAVSGEANQSQLTALLATGAYSAREVSLDEAGNFLTGGYFAVPGSVREEDEYSVMCVLEEEVAEVERLHRAHRPIDGFLLPAPRHVTVERESSLPPYLRVVPSGHYDVSFGLDV